MKRSLTPFIFVAAFGVLALASQAQAGEFSLRIGGFSVGRSSYHHNRSYSIVRGGCHTSTYRSSSYHRPRYDGRHQPRVRDITPFRGHPRVYSVQPTRRHPRVIIVPQPYYPRSGSCRR